MLNGSLGYYLAAAFLLAGVLSSVPLIPQWLARVDDVRRHRGNTAARTLVVMFVGGNVALFGMAVALIIAPMVTS